MSRGRKELNHPLARRLSNNKILRDLSSYFEEFKSPQIMGVLNITPDSFSDGGRFISQQSAIQHANQMVKKGASIIDIGGESTRPGAMAISVDAELKRVIPIIESIRSESNVVISIDTSKPEVMKKAVEAGADIINDVYALRRHGALDMAALLHVPVCLMHMQATPETMQKDPSYRDVVGEVQGFFNSRISACEKAGIERSNIILDPGFGFGKTLQHNLSLLAHLESFKYYGCPLLVGLSRKSMFGDLLGKDVNERTLASVSATLLAVINGASIVRVHDVAETFDALKIYNAVQGLK